MSGRHNRKRTLIAYNKEQSVVKFTLTWKLPFKMISHPNKFNLKKDD